MRKLTGLHILVVEDEMLVLMGIEDMLADLGCDCILAAATNEEAITLIKDQHIDAALLDLNLNGDRSYPVADFLAERGVPYAFSTGYGGHALRECDQERPLLIKPFACDDLEKVLGRLLSISR